jgi:hypothetical protein
MSMQARVICEANWHAFSLHIGSTSVHKDRIQSGFR